MSEISKRLHRVREIAKSELTQVAGTQAEPVESILVANSRYYGHRFKFRAYVAEWDIEKDQLSINCKDAPAPLKVIDLKDEANRSVVWPQVA